MNIGTDEEVFKTDPFVIFAPKYVLQRLSEAIPESTCKMSFGAKIRKIILNYHHK